MADPRYGGLIRPVDWKWNQPAFWQSSAGRLNTAEATTDSGHSVSAATNIYNNNVQSAAYLPQPVNHHTKTASYMQRNNHNASYYFDLSLLPMRHYASVGYY